MSRSSKAVQDLQEQFLKYNAALNNVIAMGDDVIDPLIAGLSHHHAHPIAQALGILIQRGSPRAESAIPALLSTLIGARKIHGDARDAVVAGQERSLPYLLQVLAECALNEDDHGVRNMLDVGCRMSDRLLGVVAEGALALTGHANQHIRDAAVSALGRLGRPFGKPAIDTLKRMVKEDPDQDVRESALWALQRLE